MSTASSSSLSFLEQYEPLDVIGNGSFGIIRKVRRKADGLIFARKELNFERMSERDRKQIVAEVNILKDLHHEHIVGYHDRYVDRDAGILYILMEYCGGGDLSGIIKQASKHNRPISEDTIWSYFMQILLALHHCHHPNGHGRSSSGSGSSLTSDGEGSAGNGRRPQILHRDLKPDNVFLDENNNVKLGDFGLSKALPQASFANTYVGTPYYMSPELMQEKAYDTKSDIWSLGCLIYELCALKPPFHEAKTHSELSILIRNGRIPPLPRGYSQSLFGVIKAMLNLNPAMRPSAAQLLQHERLELVFRVSEAEKMLSQLKSHKNTIVHRERDVAHREQLIARREQEISTMLTRKDQEILHFQQVVSQLQSSSSPASSLSSISNHLSQLSPEDFQRIPAVQRLVESSIQSQLEVAVKHGVAKREEELRVLVIKREEEVANAISKREEEIMEAVRRREQEVCEAWTRREEEMKREVEQWVAKREKEVREQVEREVLERIERERLEEELAEAEEKEREQREREQREKEREPRVRRERKDGAKGTRATKTPLEEVKNTLPQQPASRKNTIHETPVSTTTTTTRRTRYNSHTDVQATPKPTTSSAIPSSTTAFPSTIPSAFPLETPVAPRPSLIDAPPPSILQSAMKGVVLTATGEVLATPTPANAQVEKSVKRLFEECSPKVGLNFGKIFERRESSSALSFGNGNTNVAGNGPVDRSPTGSSSSSGDDRDEPPSPTTRKELEKRRASGAVREKARSREGSRETSPLAPEDDHTVTLPMAPAPSLRERERDSTSAIASSSSSMGGQQQPLPPTRIRRPSMRGHRRGSSIPPSAASAASMVASASGSVDDGSVMTRNQQQQQHLNPPQPLPHPHLSGITRSVSVPVLPTSQQHPAAPEYDFSDQENLPSPFLKKADRYATVHSSTSNGERTSSVALFGVAGGSSSSSSLATTTSSSTLSSAASSLSLASAVTTASSSSSSSSGSSSSGSGKERESTSSSNTASSNGTVKVKKRASTAGGNLLRAVAAANSVQRARKGSVGASPLVSAGLYPDSASINGGVKKGGEKVGAGAR